MTRKGIEIIVHHVLMDKLGCYPDAIFNPTLLKEDLGVDSLDMVEIIMNLEDMFEIEIPDEEIDDNIETVSELVEFIQGKL